jgi:hypothetical protein
METVMSEMFGQTLIGKPSSEFRFDELTNKQQAISEFISQTKKFIVQNSLEFEDVKRDVFRIKLPSGSIFKYDDQLPSFLRAIEKGESSTVVVVQRNGDIVAFGMAEAAQSCSVKIETIDVEFKSRRSSGVKSSIDIEGQIFDIGISHVLVLKLVEALQPTRIHTDAANHKSRYVFKSLGFRSYSDENSCLLEYGPSGF